MERVGRDRARTERHLDQEAVARPDQRDEIGGTTAVTRIDETRATRRRRQSEGVAVSGVGHTQGLDTNVTDVRAGWASRTVLVCLDVERLGGESAAVMERVDAVGKSRWPDDADSPRRPELIAEVVAQRDQIDEMVRVEVAHQDGVELAWLDRGGEPRERPLAQVEQDVRRRRLDEVRGPG